MMPRTHSVYTRPTALGQRSRATGWQTAGAWILVAIPVIAFGLIWQQYAVNVPKWDDHALRAFLYYSDQETTLLGKVHQLFRQHNEHRIVYDRVITALDYWLFGKLNCTHLMLIGNLSLVGLLFLFIAILRRADRSMYYAVPVALCLLNLSQWENMFWGMAALQNFSVVLWVLGAFYLLSYTNRLGLAIASAVLATLTSGNGLLVWPLGFVLLLLQPAPVKRMPFRQLRQPVMIWTLSAIFIIGLYFFRFEKPGGIAYVRPGVFALLKGWFAVVGASAEAFPIGRALQNSVLLGGLLVVVTLVSMGWEVLSNWLLLSRQFRQRFTRHAFSSPNAPALAPVVLFFWCSATFILGTAAIVALARTGFGADLLITSRYKIYSLTLLALLYTYAIVQFQPRYRGWTGVGGYVGGLLLAWLSYYSFLNETSWWRDWLLTSQYNWTYTTNRPVAQLDPVTERYTQPEPAFYDTTASVLFRASQQQPVPVTITATTASFNVTDAVTPAQPLRTGGNYIMARSAKRTYLFPVWQHQTSPVQARLMPSRSFTTGFDATIPKADLEAGTYQLFVLTLNGTTQVNLHPTNQTIVSEGQPVDTTKKNW
ncbi:hypothetical protein GCM10027341_09440 [Spirosoma knui]